MFDAGQLQNGNLGDYMIASIEDMPEDLNINVLEHLEADEIHGIGDISLPPVMPAVGNAVYPRDGRPDHGPADHPRKGPARVARGHSAEEVPARWRR